MYADSTFLINLTAQLALAGPWTVTSKKTLPPGGDVHDYASQAPYWWPSNISNDCPYVQWDGVRNPAADLYTDHGGHASMFHSSYILTLAWHYTGKEQYAHKAGDILRTWFITPATRMNANLNRTQLITCANTGRAIGIVDWSQQHTSVIDAAAILASGAPRRTTSDINAFRHAAIALFTGNTALAKQKATFIQLRLAAYITASGSQPQELARTRSFHYSTFDLLLGRRLAPIYGGYKAVNFILLAGTGAAPWAYPELESASDIVHASSDAGNLNAARALGKVPAPSGGDLWLLRPAVDQLYAT
ncbi:alginate lyase-domain-containing protein [Mycena epipterygia]|nr:alginate lyase-domain-containing protein [Mycena epipterygia]